MSVKGVCIGIVIEMSMEKEFWIDYHQCQIHLLKGEYREAAKIVSDYILIVSEHKDKHKKPIFATVLFFLKTLPRESVSIDAHVHLIERLVDASNSGSIFDPSFRLN